MTTPPPPDPQEPVERRRLGASALTIEDFRSVRRWLVALGLFAVVATGLAVYGLVRTEESDASKASRERVAALESRLREQVRELDRRLARAGEEADIRRLQRQTASQAEVQRLDRRVRRIEGDITDATDTAAAAGRGVQRLDNRVDIIVREVRRRQNR